LDNFFLASSPQRDRRRRLQERGKGAIHDQQLGRAKNFEENQVRFLSIKSSNPFVFKKTHIIQQTGLFF
jgi:hypothetical protein